MFARVLCNGNRVRCPLVFFRSPCLEACRTLGHVTPRCSHVCVGTDRRLHTQAALLYNGGDKPLDHDDEELRAEDSKPRTLNPEQWNKIAASYVQREGSNTASYTSSTAAVHGTEPEKRQDYDLEKLLENISVLKSAEVDKEEAGRATEKPRRTTPMSIGELVEFLHSENAQEICVINVPPELQYVQYFVTCSGKGLRHISKIAHSLADEVSERMQGVWLVSSRAIPLSSR